MKTIKKIASLLLAVVMCLGLTATVFAQEVSAGNGSATITVNNASKGETYSVYKLFDASVTGTADGSISYTGTIPESLEGYFTADSAGNISVKENVDETALFAALKIWAEAAIEVKSEVSDGSTLTFTGLAYGYYVITSSQGSSAITVTSTNPDASIYDKNSTTPSEVENTSLKAVNDTDVSIGDTVTYTVTFQTSNYDGAGSDARQITEYVVSDTLPDFLSDVTVTSIKVGNTEIKDANNNVPQFENKQIKLTWAQDGKSLYNNGAVVTIIYTAKVTANVKTDSTANTNTVTVTWGSNGKLEGTADIYSHSAAIQKVDGNGKNLAGAKFSAKGLQVNGSAGNYTVTSYDPSENATDGTEMECDGKGYLVIHGLASDVTLTVTEKEAPAGYNKLTNTFTVTPTKLSGSVTSLNAQKVINETGAVLPSTGGMGTTIFYVLGFVLVVGAAVLLITKKRMNAAK